MTGAALRIENLRWQIGGAEILSGINLDLPAGTRHAITGHNGAGKSSLLDAIAGTIQPTSGRVLLDGTDITGWPPHKIARAGVARTWQHPALCENLTVAQNLALAIRSRPSRKQLTAHLEHAGLASAANNRVAALSYGQHRRVEIAVAMAANPRLLLLDEPSAGLDDAEREQLTAQLLQLGCATTILMTDHNLELANAVATGQTVLEHGKVQATGQLRHIQLQTETRPPTLFTPHPTATGHKLDAMLSVRHLTAVNRAEPVLQDINFDLHRGEIVGVTGGNGTGKSTLLQAIAGLTPARPGSRITLAGNNIHDLPAAQRARQGLATVTQERGIFANLTVAENLRAAHTPNRTGHTSQDAFPELTIRLNHKAGNLSGGEQQMLAITRALALQPQVILLDEPFEGLAATATTQLCGLITSLAASGTAVLIAEHSTNPLTQLCTRVITINPSGTIT